MAFKKIKEKKREKKITPVGVNVMSSQVLYGLPGGMRDTSCLLHAG